MLLPANTSQRDLVRLALLVCGERPSAKHRPAVKGLQTRVSAWSQLEADRAFAAASRARRRAAVVARLRHKCRGLLPVVDQPLRRRSGASVSRGVKEIPVDAICATTEPNRAAQFDGGFRPSRITRCRWMSVFQAEQRGVPLPPISVVRVGEGYALRDGHHRVSVARARGAATIRALVEGAQQQRVLFDAHLHIVDPRFPLVANDGYLPDPFTVDDYRERTLGLDVRGGAVVSGSFQAFDQTYLIEALERLGPGFVGVTQLPATVSAEEVLGLDRAGVRAVRFNLVRGGSASLEQLEALAGRVFALAGWHAELYVDGRDLAELEPRLAALPRVSVDHLGLHRDGVGPLLRLVERGVKVKATGFGRVELDVAEVLRAIAALAPDALLFGTDLPSTRARRPFADADVELVTGALGPELAQRALHDNAVAWYGVSR